MPPHKSNDCKLSAVKYYLSHSPKNLIKGTYVRNDKYVKQTSTRKQ